MRLEFRPMVACTLPTGMSYLAFVVIALCSARPAAADWARDMFEVTQHEFGTIAAGAKAEFAFKFTNKYLYDVHVARVRSSCGCSDVRVTKDSLATYESSEVVASINSERLRGDQSSTLTVIFDKPRYAEVQLKVTVYIRGDILLEPSGFDFGEVEQGAEASRKLTVTHYGDADWKIVDVLGNADHLECELGEPVVSGNRVSYRTDSQDCRRRTGRRPGHAVAAGHQRSAGRKNPRDGPGQRPFACVRRPSVLISRFAASRPVGQQTPGRPGVEAFPHPGNQHGLRLL